MPSLQLPTTTGRYPNPTLGWFHPSFAPGKIPWMYTRTTSHGMEHRCQIISPPLSALISQGCSWLMGRWLIWLSRRSCHCQWILPPRMDHVSIIIINSSIYICINVQSRIVQPVPTSRSVQNVSHIISWTLPRISVTMWRRVPSNFFICCWLQWDWVCWLIHIPWGSLGHSVNFSCCRCWWWLMCRLHLGYRILLFLCSSLLSILINFHLPSTSDQNGWPNSLEPHSFSWRK